MFFSWISKEENTQSCCTLHLTRTLELVSGGGEQQFALHAAGPGTAGDTGLLIAALHPVWQPEETTVTVQRVGSYRPDEETQQQGHLADRGRGSHGHMEEERQGGREARGWFIMEGEGEKKEEKKE